MKTPTEIFNASVERRMRDTGRSYEDAYHIERITNRDAYDAMLEEFEEKKRTRLGNEAAAKERGRTVRLYNIGIQERGESIKRLVNEKMSRGMDYDTAFRVVKSQNPHLFPDAK